MPWRVDYHEDQMIVELEYWGDTSAADIHDATIEAIDLANEHQATRALVDCLKQASTASITDLYNLPELYKKEGLTPSIRIAIVEPAERELRDAVEFYDNVHVNRGWHVRRFAVRDDAVAWLVAT